MLIAGHPILIFSRDHRAAASGACLRDIQRAMQQAEAWAPRAIERLWPGTRNETAQAAARAFQVHPATVWRWLNGETAVPGRVVFALVALEAAEGRNPWENGRHGRG